MGSVSSALKSFNNKYYLELKDKRYNIHPTEKHISRERREPKTLRTQYQVANKTKIGRNQK